MSRRYIVFCRKILDVDCTRLTSRLSGSGTSLWGRGNAETDVPVSQKSRFVSNGAGIWTETVTMAELQPWKRR